MRAACKRFLRAAALLGLMALSAMGTRAQTVTTLPNFAQRYSTNASGDIRIIGNTILTCSGASCVSTVLDGTNATATNLNNNAHTMVNIDVDTTDTGLNGYNNSSSADFTLPTGATILKAYLYWFGQGASASVTTQRGQAKLRTAPGGAYNAVTATAIYQTAAPGTGVSYSSVADVTSLVPQGSTTFTVAGMATHTGVSGTYGGWSLVLVLADPAEPFRKLTVFDGMKSLNGGTSSAPQVVINLPLGANATPPSGAVSMRMGLIAGEGDRGTTGDGMVLRSYANGSATPNAYTVMNNELGSGTNFFNSSITRLNSHVAAKNPNYINNLGVDMDVFEVPNSGNTVIQNSTTALDIGLYSSGDVYQPSVVTTAVQLYVPNVQQDMVKTVVDLNGGEVVPGDLLEYTVAFSNTGGDYADSVVLSDAIPTGTTYVPGSLVVTGPNAGTKTDALGDDQGDYHATGCPSYNAAPCVRVRLGLTASSSAGGTLNPSGQSDTSTAVKFRVQVNAGLPPGTAITNTASVSYTARALAQSFTVQSPSSSTTSGKANLRLSKTHVGDFQQGQANAAYTLTVTNDGGVTTEPFTVTDTLPTGLTFASASGTNWSCSPVGQTVTCQNSNASPLTLGASSSISLLVNVAPDAGVSVVNTATVAGGGEAAASTGNNDASDTTTILGAPNMTITKVANATPWAAGTTGRTYTLTVTNSGTLPTSDTVTVVDTPPAGMTVTALAGTGWTCTLATRTCSRNTALGGGQSYPIITVTVTAPSASGVVNNVATVSGGGQLFTADDSVSTPTTITTNTRDFTLTKTHSGNFWQGQVGATYALTVTNVGTAVTDAPLTTVTEAPPAGLTITAMAGAGWACTQPAGPCTRSENLAASVSFPPITVTVDVSNTAGTPLINQASVSVVGEGAGQLSNNTASDSTVIDPTIDLALVQSVSTTAPVLHALFSYTMSLTNSGTVGATGVTVLDTLPAGVEFVSASASQGSYNNANGVWNIGAVAVSGTATLTLNVRAAAAGSYVNTAQVLTATERDRDSSPGNSVVDEDDLASTTVNAVGQAQLVVSKVANTPSVVNGPTGTTARYTVTVTNSGSAAASDVVVTDSLPSGFGHGSTQSVTLAGTPLSGGDWQVVTSGAQTPATPRWQGTGVGAFALGVGQSLVIVFDATVASTVANGTHHNSATASLAAGTVTPYDGSQGGNTADDVSVSSGVAVAGTVYADLNHNALRDGGETGSAQLLWVKLVPAGSPAGPALQAAAVDGGSGSFALVGVTPGDYVLVLDDNATLSDVTPGLPSGWLNTEVADGRKSTTVGSVSLSGMNFGLYNGSRVSGRVFDDNGAGGGMANDGVKQAGEAGLAQVSVRVTDAAGTTVHDSTSTDGTGQYTLWIPAAAAGTSVRVVQTNLGAYVSVGGSAGSSGGSYARLSDTVSFTASNGTSYTGLNFADVRANLLVGDQQRNAAPGAVVFYAHSFTPGSGGTLTLALSSLVSPSGAATFSPVLHHDLNCNGVLDGGDPVLATGMAAQAGVALCVIVKDNVPAGAPAGSQHLVTLTVTFTYSNASPALQTSHVNTDATLVSGVASALVLSKSQSTAAPLPGATITYVITYTNQGASDLSTIRLRDATPVHTRFVSALCGPAALPSGITACTVSQQPAVNAEGTLEWTLTGSLASAASGQVSFTVRVAQ